MTEISRWDDPILPVMLDGLVPLWVEKLKKVPLDDLVKRGRDLADVIASKSDHLVGDIRHTKEQRSSMLNTWAEAIAIGAFMPGGVRIFGAHYEATHPDRATQTEAGA